MEKKKLSKTPQSSLIYLYLLIILTVIIIWESFCILNKFKAFPQSKTFSSQEFHTKDQYLPKNGKIKVVLEENQKIEINKDLKAKIIFDSPNEAIGGLDVILLFNPKIISFQKIEENKDLFQQLIIDEKEKNEGKIKITAFMPNKTLIGNQTLAFLNFRLLKKESAILDIKFDGIKKRTDSNLISQKSGEDILNEVIPLKINF